MYRSIRYGGPTPGTENNTEPTLNTEKAGLVEFSIEGGFYTGPQTLTLRAHERITLQSLGAEAPEWQGAKAQEYLDIPRFSNAARRDASADKM